MIFMVGVWPLVDRTFSGFLRNLGAELNSNAVAIALSNLCDELNTSDLLNCGSGDFSPIFCVSRAKKVGHVTDWDAHFLTRWDEDFYGGSTSEKIKKETLGGTSREVRYRRIGEA